MKVVTALYELFRTLDRGHYKAFREGLLQPFLKLPTDGVKYVVYTNQATFEKFDLGFHLRHPAYEVRIKELDQSEFHQQCTALKVPFEKDQDHYHIDKHLCVFYYLELMFEKFNFVHDAITPEDDVVMWLDAGLFFNSCNFCWRDYIYANMNKPEFFHKMKGILQQGFTILRSYHMDYHYEISAKMKTYLHNQHKAENKIISGGLWGGRADLVKDLMVKFKENCWLMIGDGLLISDQECISLEYMKDPSRFNVLYFYDWYDYQKPLLELYDRFDPNTYQFDKCTL